MIRDLSETLRAVLNDPALAADFPQLALADIVFDRPIETFAPANTSIDLFLYDVRENLELRNNEPIVERKNGQAIVHPAPRRIDCSYLVTAWPVGGADLPLQEHRLLHQVLAVLGRYPTIPNPFLVGSLINQTPPLPMIVPQVDGLKSPAEFWTALGNQLRASFTVTATVSLQTISDVTGPLVTTMITGYLPGGEPRDILLQVGGRVLRADGTGIAGAVVDDLDAKRRTRTDADGRYRLAKVRPGNVTLRVVATGFQPLTQTIAVPSEASAYELTLMPLP